MTFTSIRGTYLEVSTELTTARDARGELGDAARLAGTAGSTLVDRVQELHEAVAGRSFGATGPGGSPARALHDGIARAVYGGLRGGVRAGTGVLGGVLDRHPATRGARPLSEHPRGRFVLGAVNGWLGDRLEEEGSALAVPCAVRLEGDDVPCSPEALATAFPRATGEVVVFLHGLMESEEAWRLGAGKGRPTYGERLQERGWTPVFLRLNTGLHISDNGRCVASLLEDLVASWPVPVRRLALVGHSMGGLVARSACHQAALDDRSWPRHVRHVVTLGAPHTGSWLERLAARSVSVLGRLPETRPVAAVIRSRSAGIKDLRHGALLDEDWRDLDLDAVLDDRCAEVPLPEGVRHHVVAATLTADPRHPLSRVIGDLLVRDASAHGRSRTRTIPFDADDVRHLGGLTHFALLNHPLVHDLLEGWLCEPRALPAGA